MFPPGLGLDFAAIKLNHGFLIVSSDPVSGVQRNIGWYAVNVSANDVATSGNRPSFMESVILLPEATSVGMVRRIALQMHRAAKALGLTIVGGHSELTPGLKKPIVVTTAFAVATRYVSAADAEEGDTIMMTKTAGIEGTAILASSGRVRSLVGLPEAKKATSLLRKLSIVHEAEMAFRSGYVHAMHDCTEGGVLGAAYEMASASKLGFEVYEQYVPVAQETRRICSALNLDPLRLIGSGALLLAVEKGKEEAVKRVLRSIRTPVTTIGRFVKKGGLLVRKDGSKEEIEAGIVDELWKLEADVPRDTT